MIDVTEEMHAAHSAVQAARRHDRMHGTRTRDELPESVLSLAREYKRCQMQAYRKQDTEPAGAHLLPDDGIIDPVAVKVAATGSRLVNLTRRERVLAMWLMESRGVSQRDMVKHLHLSDGVISSLRRRAERISEAEFTELMNSEP